MTVAKGERETADIARFEKICTDTILESREGRVETDKIFFLLSQVKNNVQKAVGARG